jgi:glycosyltransferase involved in cell wall biosynthesis
VLLVDQHPGNIYLAGQLLQCVRLSVPGGQPFAPEASACAGPNSGTGGDLVFAVDYNGYLGSTLVSLSGQLAAGRSGWAAQPWAYGILAGAYCLALAAFARTLTCRLTTMTTLTPVTSLAATATPRPASTMTDILAPIHKVIVQIPCLNEAETLPVTLAGIPRSIPGVDRVEILVIDDGSTDDTAQVARAHGADYVIRHPERRGLAAAFETGVQACLERGADVIVNTDGDNQYPGDQIPLLLGPILAAQAELVVGDRKPGDNPEFSWLKRLLQRVGSWVVAQAAGAPVPDATSGFRAYTRDAALRLYQFTRYTYTLETLIQANKKGLRVAHVSINTNPVKRPSRLMRSQWEYVKRSAATIVRLYAIYEPLRTFGLLSLPFILVGVGLIGRFLFLYLFGFLAEGVARLVQSVLIGGTSLIVGILVLIFGLLADLIAANRRLSEEALYRLRRLELQSKRYREPN